MRKESTLEKFCLSLLLVFVSVFSANAADKAADAAKPKYVFLMIGDGMGVSQRAAAEMYKRISTGSKPGEEKGMLFMNRFPVKGLTATQPYGGAVTDSAAAATALACGEKTRNGRISVGHDNKTKFRSIAYDAKDAGMKVGIISSVPLDHATPAAFFAQETSRGHYYEIAVQAASSGFNYFAGQPFLGARKDKLKGREHPVEIAKKAGYTSFWDKKGLEGIHAGADKIIWQANIAFEIDRGKGRVTLVDLVDKGIEILDNENGFFMMIEGGKIDWAGHANDLATNIRETLAFDDSVRLVYEFYKKHPKETLIVITGDHECGGLKTAFSGGFSPERFAGAVNSQKISGGHFSHFVRHWKEKGVKEDEAMKQVCEKFGINDLTPEENTELKKVVAYTLQEDSTDSRPAELKKMYGSKNIMANACQTVIARRCGVTWTSFGHTGVAVATTAIGPCSTGFGGQTDNTDIAKKLREILR